MSVIDDTNLMVSVKTYCVPADCQLVLNVTEQIVTLLQNGTILAQRHFPDSQVSPARTVTETAWGSTPCRTSCSPLRLRENGACRARNFL